MYNLAAQGGTGGGAAQKGVPAPPSPTPPPPAPPTPPFGICTMSHAKLPQRRMDTEMNFWYTSATWPHAEIAASKDLSSQ